MVWYLVKYDVYYDKCVVKCGKSKVCYCLFFVGKVEWNESFDNSKINVL